eukprot:343077_1
MPCVSIERARSGRARCCYQNCDQNHEIKKNDLRIGYGLCSQTKWYHAECFTPANPAKRGFKLLTLQRNTFILCGFRHHTVKFDIPGSSHTSIIIPVDVFEEHEQRIKSVFESYWTERGALVRQKHIFEMSVKDTKEELRKRDLSPTGNKYELQNRLRSYLEFPLCVQVQKTRNEKLIVGVSKEMRQEFQFKIPVRIEQLIVSYF